jgi:flagellar protein FlaF
MQHNALRAYQTVENATLSPRDLEASVLTRSAARLQSVITNWDTTQNRREVLGDALTYNQRLWTIFQAELLESDNPMPDEIKQNLLALSVFVDKRTFEILMSQDPQKINILIEINRNIAAGLQSH